MKTFLLTIVLSIAVSVVSGQNADAILGKWQSAHGSGRIQIYKKGDKYFGKMIWLKENLDDNGKVKTDIKNPNEKLRQRPIVGIDVLLDFEYRGNETYSGGFIYDPKSGNRYNGQLRLDEQNKLSIRAYFGISLLGKSETWTRVE